MSDGLLAIIILIVLIIGIPLFFFIILNLLNVVGIFGNKVVTKVEKSIEGDVSVVTDNSEVIVERAKASDRFFAALVDNVMVQWPFRVFYTIMIMSKPKYFNPALILIVLTVEVLVVIFYFAMYAQKHGGQTLGKKWNKIKVVDLEGNQLGIKRFLLREFFARLIPIILPLFWRDLNGIWYLTYLPILTKERRALHDLIAKTQVVKVRV